MLNQQDFLKSFPSNGRSALFQYVEFALAFKAHCILVNTLPVMSRHNPVWCRFLVLYKTDDFTLKIKLDFRYSKQFTFLNE